MQTHGRRARARLLRNSSAERLANPNSNDLTQAISSASSTLSYNSNRQISRNAACGPLPIHFTSHCVESTYIHHPHRTVYVIAQPWTEIVSGYG